MTETSHLWSTNGTGDGAAGGLSAADLTQMFRAFLGDLTDKGGVFPEYEDELEVTGTATPVSVSSGAALVYGYFYFNSAAADVAIPTPASSTRVDRIVLRADWTAQTVRITRIAGTEGAGVPSLTQSAGATWDFPLAQVSITTGGVITVTDERVHVSLVGDGEVSQVKLGDDTLRTMIVPLYNASINSSAGVTELGTLVSPATLPAMVKLNKANLPDGATVKLIARAKRVLATSLTIQLAYGNSLENVVAGSDLSMGTGTYEIQISSDLASAMPSGDQYYGVRVTNPNGGSILYNIYLLIEW